VLSLTGSAVLLLVMVFMRKGIESIGRLNIRTHAEPGGDLADLGIGFAFLVFGAVIVYLAVVGALYVMAATRIGQGRGRNLQTVLAVLSMFNIPLGLLYGSYALWVCWFNDATRVLFDSNRSHRDSANRRVDGLS
jgi:hypothetical protein